MPHPSAGMNAKFMTDSEIANLSQFVQTEIQYLEPEVYKIEYPELTYERVIPVNQVTSGAQQIAYDIYDRAGEAELITSGSKNIPRSTTGKLRKYRGIYEYGQAAAYTLMELNSARMANLPLEARELEAARYGVQIRMNKLAYFGDVKIPEKDIYGLFNNSEVGIFINGVDNDIGVPIVTDQEVAPTAVGWAEAIAAAGTDQDKIVNVAQAISEQINYMFAQINVKSLGVEAADTLCLPRQQYNLIATTVISSFTQETVLSRVIKNSPYLASEANIIVVNETSYEQAIVGADGSVNPFGQAADRNMFQSQSTHSITNANLRQDCMFALKRDPHKLKFHIATPFQFLAPQVTNFEFLINGYTSTGGTLTYYPLSQAQFFGI
jgi:hypothetical protein